MRRKVMGKKCGKKMLIKVDLYYCRAERMQNKAETLKHETHFFQKALVFHL